MKGTTLDDFIGSEDAKSELKRIIDFTFLYDPNLRENPAAPFPNRIFLYGPPGTGKSFLCRLLIDYFFETSSKANKPSEVIYIDSSFKDKYYGESERKLREKLSKFNDYSKITLMIIDEIDTLFSSRMLLTNQTDVSLLGELLKNLEGILVDNYYNNIVISTTNSPETLDDALIDRIANKTFFINGFKDKEQYKLMLSQTLNKYNLDYETINLRDEDVEFFSQYCYQHKLTPRRTKKIIDELLFNLKPDEFDFTDFQYSEQNLDKIRKQLYSNHKKNIREIILNSLETSKDF